MNNEKKKCGQFFTNKKIAQIMVNWVIQPNTRTALDPAVGPGIFLETILKKSKNISMYACEISEQMIKTFCKKNVKAELFCEDYLLKDFDMKFDAIICNPPYNKFQEISNKKIYIKEFKNKYNYQINGYSNECVYFLLKSMQELKKNGRCSYIMPYEFLNTSYGKNIKEELLKSKMLDTILKFDSKVQLFDDATTTSCILFIENKIHEGINFITIKDKKDIANFDLEKIKKSNQNIFVENDKLDINEKWIKYFNFKTIQQYKNLIQLKEIAKVKRGIATGNNEYFSLNKEKINKYKLSKKVCLPCIIKAPDVDTYFLNESYYKQMINNNINTFIFNGKNAKTSNDFEYIKLGENKGINKLYLTSHRKPWYKIEEKEAAPILISVFNRNKIKIVRNEIKIKTLTAFHGLFFDRKISQEFINILFCYLMTPIGQKILYLNKREYGAGLNKFEPNDLNNALILDITKINSKNQKDILQIYNKMRNEKNINENINSLNNIFEKYVK